MVKTAGRLKVRVYTPANILNGYIQVLPRQRRVDILNGVLVGTMHTDEAFLPFTGVAIRTLDGRETVVQSAYINKANILFAQESEEGQSRELGNEVGHKLYPYVSKLPMAVKLYMPRYTLTGQMHCAERQRLADVLESANRFVPLIDVVISPVAGGSESGLDFVAVNKEQIIMLQELVAP